AVASCRAGDVAALLYLPAAHGGPRGLASAGGDDVLAVDVRDAGRGDLRVAVRERLLAARGGVARIPVQHQRLLPDGIEQAPRLGAGGGVAGQLVFERERHALPARFDRGLAHAVVDRLAIRLLIGQTPEVEDADRRGAQPPPP